MGSGREANEELAAPLGAWIARAGYHLLTGGGAGVMETAARAFCGVAERRGQSIGIIRCRRQEHELDPETGLRSHSPNAVNDWLDIPIQTHLPESSRSRESRNHLNVLTSDALVVLPGDSGTDSELRLAAEYGRRAILFLGAGKVHGRSAAELAAERELAGRVVVAGSLEQVAAAVRQALAERGFAA